MHQHQLNRKLETEIRRVLADIPSIDSEQIGVTADCGIVHLSGYVMGVTARHAIEEAVLKVDGVRAVLDELRVRLGNALAEEFALCSATLSALDRHFGNTGHPVKAVIRGARVRLSGLERCPDDGKAAEDAVARDIGPESLEGRLITPSGVVPGPTTSPEHGGPGCGNISARLREPTASCPEAASADSNMVIVVNEGFPDGSVSPATIHHRQFPEICVECSGRDDAEGLRRLATLLGRAREHARDRWHLEAIERAIADVESLRANPSEAARVACEGVQSKVRVSGEAHPGLVGLSAVSLHEGFPEIRGVGKTPESSVEDLIVALSAVRGETEDPREIEAIDRAVADTEAFRNSLSAGASSAHDPKSSPPRRMRRPVTPPLSEAIP